AGARLPAEPDRVRAHRHRARGRHAGIDGNRAYRTRAVSGRGCRGGGAIRGRAPAPHVLKCSGGILRGQVCSGNAALQQKNVDGQNRRPIMGVMVQRNITARNRVRALPKNKAPPTSTAFQHFNIYRKTTMTKFQTPEQFAALGQANLETLMSLAQGAMARAERLAELNLNTVRSVLEDSVATTRKLAELKDPQQLASLQGELTKPLIDKAVAYARSVQEIATEGQHEVTGLFEKQIAEVNK